jgi:hypothetical protein
MGTSQRTWQEYRSLWLMLLLLGVASTAVINSCGSGGGSSNGGLCEQCGDDPDGPCQSFVEIEENMPEAPAPCNAVPPTPPLPTPKCTVALACFRKLGGAQRRCFPVADEQFRCDGERANRSTPVPSKTPTPVPTGATKTVQFSVTGPADLQSFVVTVSYPTAKGSFVGSGASVDCTTAAVAGQLLTKNDNDAGDTGILTLGVSTTLALSLPTDISCKFAEAVDEDLVIGDLIVTVNPGTATVTTTVP